MSPENFAFWLQGYFEVLAAGDDPDAELTPEQVACIKDHLRLVFEKRTPVRSAGDERRKKKAKESKLGKLAVEVRKLDFDPFTLPGATCDATGATINVTCDATKDDGITWVTTPSNPNQIRLDIENEVKKVIEKQNKQKRGIEYSPTRWVGGSVHGQKYC